MRKNFTELTGIKLGDLWFDDGHVKVLGKGNRERVVPFGREVGRALSCYVNSARPEPARPHHDFLFLTREGMPLTKTFLQNLVKRCGARAGIEGIRVSPHSFRHTAAVTFLRNGGDAFSLQRLLGHSSLDMTRRYCELADVDVKRAHMSASPVDNLKANPVAPRRPSRPAGISRSTSRRPRRSP